jgi:hypothetical protein
MTLDELSVKYGTDKGSLKHHYMEFYEQHLPKKPKRILEIGVKEGRSLAMWHEHFPDAEIFGLDLFEEYSHETVYKNIDHFSGGEWNLNKITLITGNQCYYVVHDELRKFDFDVIIDDGSHNSRDQMMTFFGLFNGKHYFIEDTDCCRNGFYQQGLPYRFTADCLFKQLPENRYLNFVYEQNIVLIKEY